MMVLVLVCSRVPSGEGGGRVKGQSWGLTWVNIKTGELLMVEWAEGYMGLVGWGKGCMDQAKVYGLR